jgi:hypothetical protein
VEVSQHLHSLHQYTNETHNCFGDLLPNYCQLHVTIVVSLNMALGSSHICIVPSELSFKFTHFYYYNEIHNPQVHSLNLIKHLFYAHIYQL